MSKLRTKQARITVAGLSIIIHNYFLQVSGTQSFYKIIVWLCKFNLTQKSAQTQLTKKIFTCWNIHIIFITNFITKR